LISATVGFFAHAAFAPSESQDRRSHTITASPPRSRMPSTDFHPASPKSLEDPVSLPQTGISEPQQLSRSVVAGVPDNVGVSASRRIRPRTSGFRSGPSSASGKATEYRSNENAVVTTPVAPVPSDKPVRTTVVPRDREGDSVRMKADIRFPKPPK
jgi:hypothetical protein